MRWVAAILGLVAACGPRAGAPRSPGHDAADLAAAPTARSSAAGLIARVPADSPLIYVALEPVPWATIERELLGPVPLTGLATGLDRLARDHGERYAALPAAARLWHGLLRATGGSLDGEHLTRLGLPPAARFAIYLDHGAVVARIELADPSAAADALTRGFAGLAEVERNGGGARVDVGALVAVAGGDLVIVAGEPAARAAARPVALAERPPERALTLAELVGLAERLELPMTGVGTLDLAGLFRLAAADGSGRSACAGDLAVLADRLPRLGFGHRFADDAELRVVVELDAADAAALAKVVRPAPRLAGAPAQLVAGLGVDLGQALPWLARRLTALGGHRFACSRLAALGASADTAAASLTVLAGTALASIVGLAVSLEVDDGRLRGQLAVTGPRPAALLALVAGRTGGALAGLRPGGGPIALPLPADLAGLEPAALALGEASVGLGVGGARPPGPPVTAAEAPFLSLSLDAALLDPPDPEQRYAAIAELDAELAEVLRAIDRGGRRRTAIELTGRLVDRRLELAVVVRRR